MASTKQSNTQKNQASLKSLFRNLGAGFVIMAGVFGVVSIMSSDYQIDDHDGQTLTTCSGTFYDSGGADGNYGNNEDYTVTFTSDNAGQIEVTFNTFTLRGSGDYLYAYDGTSTSATLIGTYSSTDLEGQTLTSTNGSLTFRFTSNSRKTKQGWEATISCTTPVGGGVAVGDTDGDGILDEVDLDDDNDGIPDVDEGCAGCSGGSIQNGDFETGPNPGSYTQTNEINVEGWETTAPDNKIEIWKTGFLSVPSQSGNHHVEINSSHHAALYQAVCTRPGAQFSWSVWHRGRSGTDAAVVKIGDNIETAPVQTTMSTGKNAWVQYTGTYTVPANQTSTYFIFESVSTAGGNITVGNFVDNIVITETQQVACLDSDQDGIPNSRDLDSDNDGIPDIIEAGGVDANGDGMVDNSLDTDGDGLADAFDNNNTDGPLGSAPCSSQPDCLTAHSSSSLLDSDGDGTNDVLHDQDSDGVHNWNDLDSDNDGVLDVVETGGSDLNRDGVLDGGTYGDNGYNNLVDPADSGTPLITSTPDASSDPDTRIEYSPNPGYIADTDGDDVPDFLDVDSDNDGIYDIYEAQPSDTFTAITASDRDGDGIDNSFDDKVGFGGNGAAGLRPVNTDNSDNPDYRDTDSDDDYVPDMQEAWDGIFDGDSRPDIIGSTTVDGDGDGLVEAFDDDDSDQSVYSMISAFPPNDDGGTGNRSTSTSGIDITASVPIVNIFPGNLVSGTNQSQADFRAASQACNNASISYAMTDARYSNACLGTLASRPGVNLAIDTLGIGRIKSCYRYDSGQGKVQEGAGSTVARATAFCLKSDDWYRFYNPAEPDHYLFAIKNGTNTVPLEEAIDYIEIELKPYGPKDKLKDSKCFIAMERSWKVVQKKALNGTVSIRFFFEPKEYQRLVRKTNSMMTQMRGTSDYKWFKTSSGVDYDNLPSEFSGYDQDSLTDLNQKGGSTSANSTDNSSFGNNKNYVQFDDLTSFSGGTLGVEVEAGSSLPVEWLSFDAKMEGNDGKLSWSTASETNADKYRVERSINGQLYETIGEVGAAGTTSNTQYYQFTDQGAAYQTAPTLYYRLRQIDLDGQYDYSNTVELALTEQAGNLSMKVFPNPANEVANISVEGLPQAGGMLRVFNMAGQQVYATEMSASPNQQIPVASWVAGTYTAILVNGSQRVTQKLIVAH